MLSMHIQIAPNTKRSAQERGRGAPPGQQPSLSSEFEFGEGDKLDLGSEFEFDKPDELGLETNSYSETYSPETLNSNSNELGNSHQK